MSGSEWVMFFVFIGVIGLAGAAVVREAYNTEIVHGDKTLLQIEECEQKLPRHLHCVAVYGAKVEENYE